MNDLDPQNYFSLILQKIERLETALARVETLAA